ncbi:MAG: hypothetical protein AAF764_01860 [Pseudomonadota bacterium]
MAMNRSITDHDDIREWAAARAGKPALIAVPTGTGEAKDTVTFEFGQQHDGYGHGNQATDTMRLVEWTEWFKAFDSHDLALVVPNVEDGVIDETHQFLKR